MHATTTFFDQSRRALVSPGSTHSVKYVRACVFDSCRKCFPNESDILMDETFFHPRVRFFFMLFRFLFGMFLISAVPWREKHWPVS